MVSTRNCFSFSYKLSFFWCLLLFLSEGNFGQSDFLGLPWHGPGASSRPVCVLGPLPSVTACLSDSPGPGQGEAHCRRKFSQETSRAVESLICASKPFMFPLPSKKKKRKASFRGDIFGNCTLFAINFYKGIMIPRGSV